MHKSCKLIRTGWRRRWFVASGLVIASVGVWFAFIHKGPIRGDRDYYWYDGGTGVLERLWEGRWKRCTVMPGAGAYFTIFHGGFDTRTFDGGWNYQVSFQLPRHIKAGDRFELRPVAVDRQVSERGSMAIGLIEPGEFTAFCFGNPSMDWMPSDSSSTATVTIKSVGSEGVRAHLKLYARLPEFVDLDIDKTFVFRKKPPETPSWAYKYLPMKEFEEAARGQKTADTEHVGGADPRTSGGTP